MKKTISIPKIGSVQRRAVRVSSETIVKTEPLFENRNEFKVIRPAVKGVDLLTWVRDNRTQLEESLKECSGILFRGFEADLDPFINAAYGSPLEYKERSSPRTAVKGNIYTSTEYPASQSIFLHNENSYQNTFPMKLFFQCVQAAETGGETPIASIRGVTGRISDDIKSRFADRGILYVRNFGHGFGLPWENVFNTTDAKVVELRRHLAHLQYPTTAPKPEPVSIDEPDDANPDARAVTSKGNSRRITIACLLIGLMFAFAAILY
ncbi:MAG: TauD/TfdA family dioxygenase, partial [Symploca sp. SIO2D2]|nr:TauD/TfdA family dioxygenase [Symploca sp. SIO2D2]